jgi:altronate dehydratase large subunit
MTRRAVTPKAAKDIQTLLDIARTRLARAQRTAPHAGKSNMLVSPGNADGGVTNVVEKALGGLHKAGTAPFQGTTGYAEPPAGKGLYLMDGPGHDGEAVSGLIGAGANIVVFTTGRGTPTGFPGVPVIKTTGNPHLFETMRANIDFNAGEVISKRRSIESVGADMLDMIVATASGLPSRAEILGHEELYSISRFIATHRFFEYGDNCGCPCGT